MQPLSDFTADFRTDLAQGAKRIRLNYTDKEEAKRRFAVYRNNVAHSLGEALARRFPVIQRLVGRDFFAALAKEFIAVHPPRSPVLQEWGGDMPGFLEGFPPVASLPYLRDVARLEWARGLAYHAADASPVEAHSLIEREYLRLHPSVQVLRLDFPAVSIWQANQPGQNGRVTATSPETALVWRRNDFSVEVTAIAEPDAEFIEMLLQGSSLAQAAEGKDPTAILSRLLQEELICEEEATR